MSKGIMKEETIHSNFLQEDIDLLIYLPPSYSPLYKYHLLIAQDGADYFNLGRLGTISDELHKEQSIENTIIVGIPYKSVEDRRDKYHPKGKKHQAYLRFLARELTSYLDENFPTYQMGMGRTLIGDSLGGTVALLAGLRYPNIFSQLILQSPMVTDDILEKVKSFQDPYLLNIYQVVGKLETAVETTNGKTKDFVTPNRELHNLLKDKKFPHTYNEFDGDHTWGHWQEDLKPALQTMLGGSF